MWYIEVMGQHLSFSIPILLNSRYNARYRLEISKAVSVFTTDDDQNHHHLASREQDLEFTADRTISKCQGNAPEREVHLLQ